jgi:hypothetical protein
VPATSGARTDSAALRSGKMARRAARRPRRESAPPRGLNGDVCFYVDSRGRQHFNFPQRIWLYPSVQMAVTPMMSIELETLAVNLLTPLTRERDCPTLVGVTSKRVRRLAGCFCAECLLTARSQAWVIPRSTIRAWLASHTKRRSRLRMR